MVGLIQRLQNEADLCRNDGASDIAALLDEAVKALQVAAAPHPPIAQPQAAPTDEEIASWADSFILAQAFNRPIAVQIAVEAAKWVRSRLAHPQAAGWRPVETACMALTKINEWACFATEEDVSARLLALQQIGIHARAAINAIEVAQSHSRGWMPIDEAPAGVELLLGWWDTNPHQTEDRWCMEVGKAITPSTIPAGSPFNNGYAHGQATHWQPLPEPPKEGA